MTATEATQPASAARRRPLPGPISQWALEILLRSVARRYGALQWFLEVMPPGPADAFSQARALRAARNAGRHVPAYRDYLQKAGLKPDRIRDLHDLPETDKNRYIDRYPLAQRCIDGRLPLVGTTIDESSGRPARPTTGPAARRSGATCAA